ncbi:glycoside hydrolase family 32 protein [Lachnobacterium bovis]|uniref:Sucrose-6-phosphate hydrolase n=1 Tax=Lachnobacterium bovis TaxID=140626 RepID=A0A1H9QZX4_9FIRM|nr:glycoside hydrolase family 32 protein [Lachnobacterium bovis]SER66026.1 beta-fructofuranosidase [Lachnobacterium bovis]
MTRKLFKAREYEEKYSKEITKEERPDFHLTPYVGWMNDPNGFSYYKDKYHLFYQYHPYDTNWGPMHWGHAVSEDLLHWEYLPVSLACDMPYDKDGVFSGSAVELDDGRHLLMYTGVKETQVKRAKHPQVRQMQCIAIGDGKEYEKYENNPVIDETKLPKGASLVDFRDPKIVKTSDNTFLAYMGSRDEQKSGQILVYESKDALNWKFKSVLIKNNGRLGTMWECPDVFELEGYDVLLASPQDVTADQFEGLTGNVPLAAVGHIDKEAQKMHDEDFQVADYGMDFYAHQTVLSPDGRRIMIGWLQNWDSCSNRIPDTKWYGQMSVPRELHIKDGKLYQTPIKELENYRENQVLKKDFVLQGQDQTIEGLEGRTIDTTFEIALNEESFNKFEIKFASNANKNRFCSLLYRKDDNTITLDRLYSGTQRALMHQKSCKLDDGASTLKLRLVLDKYSAELFINDGQKVMSMSFYTELDAQEITLSTDGKVKMSVEKYDLKM